MEVGSSSHWSLPHRQHLAQKVFFRSLWGPIFGACMVIDDRILASQHRGNLLQDFIKDDNNTMEERVGDSIAGETAATLPSPTKHGFARAKPLGRFFGFWEHK